MINELEICKLYNEIDVTIPFNDSGIKILISENGMGKTTVLKILHAVLTRQFYRLDAIDFDKIVLTFNNEKVIIRQSDLHPSYMADHLPHEFKTLRDALSENNYKILLDSARRLPFKELKEMPLLEYSAKITEAPRAYLAELLKKFKFDLNESLSDIDRKITNCFSSQVLYLPTFRRIEEDLRNLGLVASDLLKLDELVRSGMQDIQEKIDKATWEIRNALYSRLTDEQWFFELADILNILDNSRADDVEHLKTVLDRIGGDISKNGLDAFLNQVDPNTFDFPYETDKENKYEILKERLAGVMKTYTYQKQKQKDINEFVRTCNKYLIDKEIVYDETQGHTKFVKVGGSELDSMEKMSSGEKQIVSLFARLYFDFEKTCLVIIDEPENSMSIEWQKMLLPDILETPKCGYLIAATHSPFIFNNKLNLHTVALNEYIRRSD